MSGPNVRVEILKDCYKVTIPGHAPVYVKSSSRPTVAGARGAGAFAWWQVQARARATRARKPSVTPAKARQILHDKTIRGVPLTEAQRRYFGAVSRRKNSEDSAPAVVPEASPADTRRDFNAAIAAWRASLHIPEKKKAAAETILTMLKSYPWLHDQIPFDVLDLVFAGRKENSLDEEMRALRRDAAAGDAAARAKLARLKQRAEKSQRPGLVLAKRLATVGRSVARHGKHAGPLRTYEVLSLDVWGNEEDGFEVNQVFRTGDTITVSPNATDDQIVRALIRAGLLNTSARGKVRIDDPGDGSFLTVEDASTGEPIYNLSMRENPRCGRIYRVSKKNPLDYHKPGCKCIFHSGQIGKRKNPLDYHKPGCKCIFHSGQIAKRK